jgi:hypothetical protein
MTLTQSLVYILESYIAVFACEFYIVNQMTLTESLVFLENPSIELLTCELSLPASKQVKIGQPPN